MLSNGKWWQKNIALNGHIQMWAKWLQSFLLFHITWLHGQLQYSKFSQIFARNHADFRFDHSSINIPYSITQKHVHNAHSNRMFGVPCGGFCCNATIIHLKLKCQIQWITGSYNLIYSATTPTNNVISVWHLITDLMSLHSSCFLSFYRRSSLSPSNQDMDEVEISSGQLNTPTTFLCYTSIVLYCYGNA